jgi:hypothetical protein
VLVKIISARTGAVDVPDNMRANSENVENSKEIEIDSPCRGYRAR